MNSYVEPQWCYKCKEIVTFCECGKPIADKEEYINYLEEKLNEHKTKS